MIANHAGIRSDGKGGHVAWDGCALCENKTNPPLPLWLCAIPIALALPLAECNLSMGVLSCVQIVQSLFELYNSKPTLG